MSRVAVVTGGTRGIGAATSMALKTAGYKVAANYVGNDEAAQKFKSETGIPVYKWDVSSFEACAAGLQQVASELGPVEVLVNNAGITRDTMFHRMKPEQWTAVVDTNLGSLFNMCRPVIEGMRERKFGRIINISSINGQKGQVGQVNYSAAKAGELGFTKALAQESARSGVTVNAVCPGYIATEMVKAVEAALGPVEVLVNNAGITRDAMFHRMTPEQWSAVVNTNLSSLFNMCRPVIEGMRARKFGRIVNISSINGQKGQMGQTNYSAAKAGELGFTKALAQESAKSGITVNAICPGYINTEIVQAVPKDVLEKNILPLIPVGRLGEPEEIARCVVFLASDDAGFITGSTMTVNGAQYLT